MLIQMRPSKFKAIVAPKLWWQMKNTEQTTVRIAFNIKACTWFVYFTLKSIPTKSVRCDTERKKIENTFWIDSLRLTFKRRPTFVQAISRVHQTLLDMQTLTTNALRIYHVLWTNVERGKKMWLKKENKNENQKKGKKIK